VSSCEWNLAYFRYSPILFFIESWGTFHSIHHKVFSNTAYTHPAESSAQKIFDSAEEARFPKAPVLARR